MKHIIGFDAKRIVRNRTGLGSYARTLVNDLCHDDEAARLFSLRLYAPDRGHDDLRRQIDTAADVAFAYPEHTAPLVGKALWRTSGITQQLKADGVSIFHGLSGELPLGIAKSGIRTVVTIHDLIFMRHPEFYPWIDAQLYKWKFRQTVRQADIIVAISERTRQDIIELGGVDSSRIRLVYQSCHPRFATPLPPEELERLRLAYLLPRRYLLSVGTIERRKNILLAVKAMQQLPQDVSLVVVGRPTTYTDEVISYINEHHLEGRVILRHDVTNEALPAFYQLAEGFVYPSVYEGFGIPIIEAISCRLPVAACTGSCLEEAGGPDCLYAEPDDVDAMAEAMRQLLVGAPEREQRICRSYDYISRFANTHVAQRMTEVYKELLRDTAR